DNSPAKLRFVAESCKKNGQKVTEKRRAAFSVPHVVFRKSRVVYEETARDNFCVRGRDAQLS
ncbi:MAG: hypothetical protein II681_08145, partial [Bacteroidaceae bacterium]|nr:hypothetical protein [Bacteroidaceae bacterium]